MPLHHRLSPVLVLLGLCCASVRTSPPEVQTPAGTFRGKILTSHSGQEYAAYRGIPYALPPTGDRRFALPVRHPVIEETFDAGEFGSVCLQHKDGSIIGDENCLFINVFTPLGSSKADSDDELRKVFVFIHGGGLVIGASNPYLAGDLVTRGNLIVATLNYRLNWFGFLRGNSAALPGNQGHWDQLLALQWIRDNIRSFGGDPLDVTISGESVGSMSVSLLAVSPLVKGLFTRAVLLSGVINLLPIVSHTSNDLLQTAANKFGCGQCSVTGNEEAVVKCLKQLPGETFVKQFYFESLIGSTSWGDDLLPEHFDKLMNDTNYLASVGFFNRDYIVSITKEDGYIFINARFGSIDTSSEENSVKGISQWLPLPKPVIKLIIDEYEKIFADADQAVTVLTTDITFLKVSLSFAGTLASQQHQRNSKKNTYFLSFDHAPKFVHNKYMLHALDLAYLFDVNVKELIENFYYIDLEDKFYEEDVKLKGDYIDLIADFVKTGNPNGKLREHTNVVWPPYNTEKKRYLSFSLQPSVREDIMQTRRHIWDNLVPRWLEEHQQTEKREEL